MARLSVYLLVFADRFWTALRTYWRRILVGCGIGWVVGIITGAFLLVKLEKWTSLDLATLNLIGAFYAWSIILLGGIVSYGMREEDERNT